MSLFKNIWQPRSGVVVFVLLTKDGCVLSAINARSSSSVHELKELFFDTIEDLFKHFGNNKAYYLQLEGSGVLTREVNRIQGYKDDLIINSDKDDFYFSSVNDGSKSLVSFVRKQSIAELLQAFQKAKIHLLQISCGPIVQFANLNASDRFMGNFELETKQGAIFLCRKIEAQQYPNYIANNDHEFSALAHIHVGKNQLFSFELALKTEEAQSAFTEYREHRKFIFFGLVGLFTLFVIVLGNYLYINQLNNNIAELETEVSLSNDNLIILDGLDQEIIRKEQLLESSGLQGSRFIAFYLDKIGQTVPLTICLKTLQVYPLTETLKEKRKVNLNTGKVEIEGVTKGSAILDDWIERLNRFEWAKSIELVNYSKLDEHQAQFKLIIQLSE